MKIYLYQMIRAIIYLHSLNICHRDIKPHNFVLKNNRIFLCDFGAAKIISKNNEDKNASYVFSREYRPP
jgi:glycogen synthase kinase 3 beta